MAPPDRTEAEPSTPGPRPAGMRSAAIPLALLALFSAAYFAWAARVATIRPLWYDEILTYDLAGLPDDASIMAALADGPDHSPPLNLLVVHRLFRALGAGSLAVRLPAILGTWACGLCLMAFVGRARPGPFGWVAAAALLTTQASAYAVEGRPYGLWLGSCGAMLLCWQSAASASGAARWGALAGLALGGAAAVSCHFFAPLTFIPIGLGELARSWRRRRIDMPIWVGLAAGLLPLPLYLPIIRNVRSFAATFYARGGTGPTTPLVFYSWLLEPAAVALAVALAVLAAMAYLAPRPAGGGPPAPEAGAPVPEVVAALGYAAMPFIVYLFGRLNGSHVFVPRYCLAAAIGVGLLVAFLAPGCRARPRPARALALALLGCAALNAHGQDRAARQERDRVQEQVADLARLGGDATLATDASLEYAVAAFYAPPSLNDRMVLLVGPESRTNTTILCLHKLARWDAGRRTIRIEDLDSFLEAHDRFALFAMEIAHLWRITSRGFRVDPRPAGGILEARREGVGGPRGKAEGATRGDR